MKTYAVKCVELTWYFNVQNPKLHLQWDDEGKEIGDHLRHYTKSGNVIGYQVWPSLFLHEGGPLLQKGIVQPK